MYLYVSIIIIIIIFIDCSNLIMVYLIFCV